MSESIDALMPAEEIVFYRLLVNCDDFGRMDGRVAVLRAKLFPLRQISPEQLKAALDRLEALQMIRRYQVKAKPYLFVVNWDAHQTIRAKRSKYPPPEYAPGATPEGASPVPQADQPRQAPEKTLPPAAKNGAAADVSAPKPDTPADEPSAGEHPPAGEPDAADAGEPSAPNIYEGKAKPSPATKAKAGPIKKQPRHKKQKARAAPGAAHRAAVREQAKAPPGGQTAMAAAPYANACAPPESLPGPSPPGDFPAFKEACMHVQADASNCKQMHADEINCKQMQADAFICSRNPIRIQSEKESQSVSVSPGIMAAADASAFREGISAIEKQAAALGMPFASADRDLAESLMAEFTLNWLLEAMRRAGQGQASCRSWRYIRAILSAWRAKGGIDSVHGGSHTGGEGQGLREAQGDVRAALLIRRY